MVVNINGQLHPMVSRLLTSYGFDASQEKVSSAASTHGGHSGLRTCENQFKAHTLNSLWASIISRPTDSHVVLDIGSKFASDYSIAV